MLLWRASKVFSGQAVIRAPVTEAPDLQKEANTPIKQDIKKGKLRDYPYNIRWNYGMLPRTWEDPEHKNDNLGGILVSHKSSHRREEALKS